MRGENEDAELTIRLGIRAKHLREHTTPIYRENSPISDFLPPDWLFNDLQNWELRKTIYELKRYARELQKILDRRHKKLESSDE